jgi:hypothetical protein
MKIMDRCGASMRAFVAVAAGVSLMSAVAGPAAADGVKWQAIIGIVQAANVVGGIGGGGQPWTTLEGQAKVDLATGQMEFEVHGLVLAGGDTIGTPGAVSQVKGTLVCIVPAPATNVVIDSPLVSLSSTGDAQFSGAVGAIPTSCNPTNIAFLIRIGAGRWIANGAVRSLQGPKH